MLANFSQRAMKRYHPMMVDIAVQLVQKWARLNPEETVEVAEDMTRLTLDTIGLCGFNYRFNSYYRDQPHPFILSMVNALGEAMSQMQRLPIQDKLMVRTKRQFHQDIQSMFALVDQIIADRKASGGTEVDDLLSHMLNSKDPETGEGLDDENIRFQIITFLIAGHETTSGLLSFALHFLMKHPDVLQKAYEEVDRVLTGLIPTYQQVVDLKYVRMILNESLRLWPTAPGFALYAKEDTVLGGKYSIQKGERFTVLLPQLHRDRGAWGEDADQFRPERFVDMKQIPHHAFKPFGNGQRACIGQQFAMHEATLVLGMVLKHFELIDHTNYELKIKQTLTLKPDGLTMQVKPRAAITATLGIGTKSVEAETKREAWIPELVPHDTPLLVLYGSSLGTVESVARGLVVAAEQLGFATEMAPLDQYVGQLPREGAVLITCSSYNGRPPANARAFLRWLEEANSSDLQAFAMPYLVAVIATGRRRIKRSRANWMNNSPAKGRCACLPSVKAMPVASLISNWKCGGNRSDVN